MISRIYKQITTLGFLFIILCFLSFDASDSPDLSYKTLTEYIIPNLESNPIKILYITIPTISLGVLLLYRYIKSKKYTKVSILLCVFLYISFVSVTIYNYSCREYIHYKECSLTTRILDLIRQPEAAPKTPFTEKLESQILLPDNNTTVIEVGTK